MMFNNKFSKLTGVCIASTFLFAGCAQQPTSPDADSPMVQTKNDAVKTAGAATRTPVKEEIKPDYLNMNPVLIQFEKMSAELSDSDKKILEQISERAKKAERLSIFGYCDRNQIGNAKAAAIKRAVAVKDELVRHGVDPNTIRIRYLTEVANKHAAEIRF